MEKNRSKRHSLQVKISSIYIIANLLVMSVNALLLIGINNMSGRLDSVYQENLHLNELADALTQVQDNMTDYMNVKTSEALENYYRSEETFSSMVEELSEKVTSQTFDRMERSIKYMSQAYLSAVSQTIEAKRGRNVEKYRVRYENATKLYEWIGTYITSLNVEQFRGNSVNYRELMKSFRLFEKVLVIAMIMVMVCNVAIIIIFTGTLIKPLKRLAASADDIAGGNLDIKLLEVETTDEVGVVTGAFNQMVVSIRQYVEKIRESMETERAMKEKELLMESHLKDARLRYLQAQINPHFLFNTLNAGAQLAMMEDADRTYDYVQKVARFYRYNMKKSQERVTIAEEIEIVDYYIYILNVRFSGDIHYEKNIDETLLAVKMPGMILQPIVENCVNHGIREMAGDGKITLSVFSEDALVCISVRDNGIGMSKKDIEKVMDGTFRTDERMTDSNGIGMDNVISRMKLFTGNEAAMKIFSEGEGKGTEVLLYVDSSQQPDGL